MQEVDEGMSFCREHGRMLNNGLIDNCPKCGRYKDIRQKHCPDCTYGRPVANWKVSSRNLDEITEHKEAAPEANQADRFENQEYSPDFNEQVSAPPARGEAMCPSCGSTNLTYKDVFDYFRCNDCETTFITPVYSYGEPNRPGGTAPSKPVNRETAAPPPLRQQPPARRQEPLREPPPPPRREEPRIQQRPVQWEEPAVQRRPVQWEEPVPQQRQAQWEEPAPPVRKSPWPISFGKLPNLDIMRRHEIEERAISQKALKMQGQASNIGWLYLLIVLSIVALTALICWVFLSEQISGIIDGLL